MIKVAICGHVVFSEGDITSALRDCALSAGVEEPYIREFSNPTDLIDACTNVPPDAEPLDLVICAMDLSGVSGVHVAQELHDAGIVPHDLQIVICAPSDEGAYDACVAEARGYLLEPVSQSDFNRVIEACLQGVAQAHAASMVVRCRNRVRRIAFSRVRFIETSGHDQLIHLVGEREAAVVRSSSKAIFAQLADDGRFFKVGSSYIVNLDYVRQLLAHAGVVAFDDGFQIPVPVRMRKALGDSMAARSKLAI